MTLLSLKTPSKFKKDWLWIIILGLVVQAFWAWRLTAPTYMDAYYYTINGQRLADGYGFTVPVVWQFLDGGQNLPAFSHTYWMPLPSLMAMMGYWWGDSFRVAQLPFYLMASLLPLISFMISTQLVGERWQAWAAALFTAAGGRYAAFLSQPTSFAPYALLGGLFFLFLGYAWLSESKSYRYWVLAGILAGLLHLTRADGALFALVAGVVWLVWVWPQRQSLSRSHLYPVLVLAGGYLLIMLPWFIHNMIVMERPMPTAGTQTIFLTNYNDLFAYGRSFTLSSYLAWGWDNILNSKIEAFWVVIQTFLVILCLIVLLPFILIGWRYSSKQVAMHPFIRPLTWYILSLSLIMILLFTLPSARGSFFHSSTAIWTWMSPLAVLGLSLSVDWVAQRLTHWQPATAKPRFASMFIIFIFLLTPVLAGIEPTRVIEADAFAQLQATLPSNSVVMAGNPPMLYYHTGLSSISVPNEPIAGILQAAQDFGVTHILLDMNHPPPASNIWLDSNLPAQIEYVTDYPLVPDSYWQMLVAVIRSCPEIETQRGEIDAIDYRLLVNDCIAQSSEAVELRPPPVWTRLAIVPSFPFITIQANHTPSQHYNLMLSCLHQYGINTPVGCPLFRLFVVHPSR